MGRNDVQNNNQLWTCVLWLLTGHLNAENYKRGLQSPFPEHKNIYADKNCHF